MFRNITIAAVFAIGATSAHAAVIDLTELGLGDLGSRDASIAGVTIDAPTAGATLTIGEDNSVCSSIDGVCGGNLKISFDDVPTGLMLNANNIGGAGVVVATAQNAEGVRTNFRADENGMFDLSAVADIQSIFLGNRSGGAVSFSDIKFGDDAIAPTPSPVSLPATLPLLLAGLGGFAMMRRRTK